MPGSDNQAWVFHAAGGGVGHQKLAFCSSRFQQSASKRNLDLTGRLFLSGKLKAEIGLHATAWS
jgi:hypothetical protein